GLEWKRHRLARDVVEGGQKRGGGVAHTQCRIYIAAGRRPTGVLRNRLAQLLRQHSCGGIAQPEVSSVHVHDTLAPVACMRMSSSLVAARPDGHRPGSGFALIRGKPFRSPAALVAPALVAIKSRQRNASRWGRCYRPTCSSTIEIDGT